MLAICCSLRLALFQHAAQAELHQPAAATARAKLRLTCSMAKVAKWQAWASHLSRLASACSRQDHGIALMTGACKKVGRETHSIPPLKVQSSSIKGKFIWAYLTQTLVVLGLAFSASSVEAVALDKTQSVISDTPITYYFQSLQTILGAHDVTCSQKVSRNNATHDQEQICCLRQQKVWP